MCIVRSMSGPTNTGWKNWRISLGIRKKKILSIFLWFFRIIVAKGHWQWGVHTLQHPWKSVGNMFGNVKCRPEQKMHDLPLHAQRKAPHSDFSVTLLFFPTVHPGQESHSKIILKCISQQEAWYLCQKSQEPVSEATSNRSVKCPWHRVPWLHIKPQLILILRLAKTEKTWDGFLQRLQERANNPRYR